MSFQAGDRVRVSWSGKTGRVLESRVRRYHPDEENVLGVLVLLDPFMARLGQAPPETIENLEVIYHPDDLTLHVEETNAAG